MLLRVWVRELDTKFTRILALNEHGPFAVLHTFISGVSSKREYCL